MLPNYNHIAGFLFVFCSNFPFLYSDRNTSKLYVSDELMGFNGTEPAGSMQWDVLKPSKKSIVKFKIKKRTSRQTKLGDKCQTFQDCPPTALCVGSFCACPYDYYNYVPQSEPDMAECRKKLKYGFLCSLTDDCWGYDRNSACTDGICKCINGTHYIGSRSLLSYNKKCYKILERQGDVCEIDEQCSRLADNIHKCRCVGRCDCTSLNRYSGCSICHENIKRTFFGGAAFIILLLTSRVFSKMRSRTSSRQMPSSSMVGSRERCYRLNTSRTVPSVSYSRSNLRGNRQVTGSLPDVFLIETHNLLGFRNSNTTDFYPQMSSRRENTADRNDAPPSYEDIIGENRRIWNEPPPAYHEVAAKTSSQRPIES